MVSYIASQVLIMYEGPNYIAYDSPPFFFDGHIKICPSHYNTFCNNICMCSMRSETKLFILSAKDIFVLISIQNGWRILLFDENVTFLLVKLYSIHSTQLHDDIIIPL